MRTALPTTRLGWTDMLLTRVGFGAWAIGGGGWAYGWGDQDDTDSVAAIRHAVESGINWIDTAAVYGLGHSEQVGPRPPPAGRCRGWTGRPRPRPIRLNGGWTESTCPCDAADDVLLWAHEHETGVIVYSPMASGLLTGTFSAGRAASLDPGDWRASHPDFNEPALSANLALAEALRPVAERHGVTPAAVAVAWTLTFPGVTGAIAGARRPRQVDGWLPAATLELKEDDLADIAAAIHAPEPGPDPVTMPPSGLVLRRLLRNGEHKV